MVTYFILANAISCRLRLSKCTEIAFASLVYRQRKSLTSINEKKESSNEIEIIAIKNEKIIGTAGIEAVGSQYKLKHRADFGISILKEYWGIGVGKALTKACIQCAKEAGYEQLELNVVSENTRAISLY